MRNLIPHLRRHGARPAVHTAETTVSYQTLADLVETAATELGGPRKLVLLETRNDIDTLTWYLGALAAGHVVLPVPPGADHTDLLDTYGPDIVIDARGAHSRRAPERELHPDLAVLMSTSGSTGSPKLVRLSAENLIANAHSIAEYLDIRDTDCAATTLPMSYCYGLSVVHSHLLRGAALLLTELSVIDGQFWDLFRTRRATTFAGVPYTFDLLNRIGFESMELPHLRYVTQAGGAMTPQRVRAFAELGRRKGWALFVMYGATEATARMAYLPPEFAVERPEAIGRAIPGGHLRVDGDIADGDTGRIGELVYTGPNVMMGYAHDRADLATGRVITELRTGDLARVGPDGLFEVVGRANRIAKLFGLRIDLQRVEMALRERELPALCAAVGEMLVVATTAPTSVVRSAVTEIAGLPAGSVDVVTVEQLPMLASGKPDYPAVQGLHTEQTAAPTPLRAIYADVLHLDPAGIDPRASFVDLGGNSLSYVAMSVRIERALGRLPRQWAQLPLAELEALQPRRRRWTATMETSVALRAVAIVLIVGSHAELFEMWGGAHILLGVAGYNFGRFCLTGVPRTERIRRLRNTIGWIAVPTILWIAITMSFSDDYGWTNLLLANKIVGPFDSMTAGRLWFIEVLVWILVLLTLALALPAVDRIERAHAFGFAAVFLVAGLILRYLVTGEAAWFSMAAFWFFAVGWAVSKATTVWQRAAVTVVTAVGVYGYFADPVRETLVLGGLALLIWLPSLRCPIPAAGVLAVLADASLYIYLTHFQIYPLFGEHRLAGVLAALAVGVGVAQAIRRLRQRLAASPSWTIVAATTPSARTSDAVTTPRPRAAAGDRDSNRFH